MAYTSSLNLYCITGGQDGTGGNGLGYDAGVTAGMATDGSVISGSGIRPVFSSASYAFTSSDVGAWLHIASAPSSYPGFYNILSVASSAATLNASISGASLSGGCLNPTQGVSLSASQSGITWSVNYALNQSNSVKQYTDLAIDVLNLATMTSALKPFTPNLVGNIISISAGTNFTVQRCAIVSITGSTVTCDKVIGLSLSTGGKGGLGGAGRSPGYLTSISTGGTKVWIQTGTYLLNSTTAMVAGGRMQSTGQQGQAVLVRGYTNTPGDETALTDRPILKWNISSALTMLSTVAPGTTQAENLILDGANGLGTTAGISINTGEWNGRRLKLQNFGGNAVQLNSNPSRVSFIDCEITGISGGDAILLSSSPMLFLDNCYIHDNKQNGVNITSTGRPVITNSVFANHLGSAITDTNTSSITCINNVFYNNKHGIDYQTPANLIAINNIFEKNLAYGINITGGEQQCYIANNGFTLNLSGSYGPTITPRMLNNNVFSSSSFMINPSGGNFAPNLIAGQGPTLVGTGFPQSIVGNNTLTFTDIGVIHPQIKGNSGGGAS